MSLLREIQDAATDSHTELPALLRKCKVLGARLGNTEFKQWVDYELNGYTSVSQLPDYRIFNVISHGHFSGAYGKILSNADIPLSCIPKELHQSLSLCHLIDSVAALEKMIENKHNSILKVPWNSDLVALVSADIYQDMVCLSAWKTVPASQIVSILDCVKTRVLSFILEIETISPEAGEDKSNSNPVVQEKITQIFNTYITGTVENLATGSSNVNQTAIKNESNDALFLELLNVLRHSEVNQDIINQASNLVEEMRANQGGSSFKNHYLNFIAILADHMQVLGPLVNPFLLSISKLIT